jgi:rubrerythrin
MINRDNLIASLKKSLDAEERAVPIYSKHLNSTLFFSGLDKDFQERIKGLLSILAKESIRHEQVLRTLIKKIERSSKDVY